MASIMGRIFVVASLCLLVVAGIASGSLGPDGRETLRLGHLAPRRAIGDGDGRILVLGQTRPRGTDMARLLANGSPDGSFGERGVVTLGFSVADVAVQSNGRIVAVGSDSGGGGPGDRSMVVAGLLPNGRTDASFGDDGMRVIEFGQPEERGRGVTITADDKVVVAGTSGDPFSRAVGYEAVLARLRVNGAPDPFFGDGGKARLGAFVGFSAFADDVTALPGGKIVVAVEREDRTLEVVRLLTDGSPDPRFGSGGVFAVEPPGVDWRDGVFFQPLNQIGVLSDGRIVVAGTRETVDDHHSVIVLRYLPSGRLDPTFGTGGIARPPLRNSAAAFAAQPSGKVVLASGQESVKGAFTVLCFKPNGRLDRRFGRGGRAEVSFGLGGWKSLARAVLFQGRGKVTIAGISTLLTPSSPFPQRVGLARLRLRPGVR